MRLTRTTTPKLLFKIYFPPPPLILIRRCEIPKLIGVEIREGGGQKGEFFALMGDFCAYIGEMSTF